MKMASIVRKIVRPSTLTKPIAPYSHGVLVNNTLYVSGQIGMDPKTQQLTPGGVESETKQALDNVGQVLKEVGANYENVVKTTVLLADMKDYETVNRIYGLYFTNSACYPARACYQVACLPKNCRVEIEAIAVVGDIKETD